MANEKRSLLLELLAKDKTAAATRSAAGNLDDVADAAGDADRATEKLGKSGKTAARHVEHLDREIESCEKELRQLAVAFAEAETAADRADLSKAIRRTEKDLKDLSKARGKIGDLVPSIEEEVKSKAGGLSALGSKLGTSLGGSMGTTAGVVAAPLILSAIGGVISAGAGAGAIGLGIGLAIAKDPAIKAAGKELGKTLFDNATTRARTALHDPIMDILGDLGNYGETIVDQWGDAFDKLAPAVRPFVNTIVGAVTDLSGTLADIAGDSGPALKALGDGFDEVADSVGGALERITGDSERNADALEILFATTSTAIEAFGLLAEGAMELAGPLIEVYNASKLAGEGIGEAAIAAGLAEGPTHKLRGLHIEAAGAMDQATTSAYNEVAALKSLAIGQKALSDPTFALIQAQDDLAKAQTSVNKAQKEHGQNSPEYRAALHQAAEAALALQSAAGEVATTSTGRLDPALKATLQTAGVTAETIHALEGEFASAKRAGDRFAKTYTAKVDVIGLQAAKRVARLVSETLAAIKDENVHINYITSSGQNSSRLRSNLDKNREFGGPVKQGHAYVVGEKRAEVFVPDRDGKILPSVEQYQRAVGMQPAAAPMAYSGAPAGVTFTFEFGLSELGQLMAKSLRTQPAVASAVAAAIKPYVTS